MAPGRGRKGETRMDAALDALVPMGFSKADIRKTVKKLLKVYGGTEGWVFIEDGHYKLLIEALLGGEDGSESGPPLLMNESVNMDGDAGPSSAAGPSNAPEIPLEMIPPLMAAEKNCGSHQDSDFSFPQQELADRVFPSQTQHNPPSLTARSPSPPPPPPDSPPPPPPPPPPAAQRKPCYGWWGDETEDFICLPLMPVRPRRV